MKRKILLITLAALFVITLITVGLVWAQADELPPCAYLPMVIMDVDKPTPQSTSTPTTFPTPTPPS